jgi:putative lipoprotein
MKRALLLVLIAISPGPVCALAQATSPAAVSGTVTYKQRVALPPEAVVQVQLQDTSRADTAARTIGQATIPTAGAQVPIPYRIEYDPSTIDPSHSYAVRATVTVGDRLLFASTKVHPVLTRGAGNEAVVEVFMILPTAGSPGGAASATTAKPAATLEDTDWKLASIGDAPAVALPAGKEASFKLHSGEHRMSGSGGCNRLIGSYELSAGALKFLPAGRTMMACEEKLMQLENEFLSALNLTTGYRIIGDTLELRNGERVLARFTARKSK